MKAQQLKLTPARLDRLQRASYEALLGEFKLTGNTGSPG
jgi:hypothetical protein